MAVNASVHAASECRWLRENLWSSMRYAAGSPCSQDRQYSALQVHQEKGQCVEAFLALQQLATAAPGFPGLAQLRRKLAAGALREQHVGLQGHRLSRVWTESLILRETLQYQHASICHGSHCSGI